MLAQLISSARWKLTSTDFDYHIVMTRNTALNLLFNWINRNCATLGVPVLAICMAITTPSDISRCDRVVMVKLVTNNNPVSDKHFCITRGLSTTTAAVVVTVVVVHVYNERVSVRARFPPPRPCEWIVPLDGLTCACGTANDIPLPLATIIRPGIFDLGLNWMVKLTALKYLWIRSATVTIRPCRVWKRCLRIDEEMRAPNLGDPSARTILLIQ